MNKAIFLLVCIIVAAFCALYFPPISFAPLNNFIIGVAEDKTSSDIDAGQMTVWPLRRIAIKDFKAVYKKGVTVTSEKLDIDYDIFTIVRGFIGGTIQLNGVVVEGRFDRNILADIELPISSLSSAKATFSDIRTDFKLYRKRVVTDNLMINGSGNSREGLLSIFTSFMPDKR